MLTPDRICGGCATPGCLATNQHRGRHLEHVIQERPQSADGHQLQRKPDLNVVPAPSMNERHVRAFCQDPSPRNCSRCWRVMSRRLPIFT